jgi:hypothetical protein
MSSSEDHHLERSQQQKKKEKTTTEDPQTENNKKSKKQQTLTNQKKSGKRKIKYISNSKSNKKQTLRQNQHAEANAKEEKNNPKKHTNAYKEQTPPEVPIRTKQRHSQRFAKINHYHTTADPKRNAPHHSPATSKRSISKMHGIPRFEHHGKFPGKMIQHQNKTDDNDKEEKTIQESQREKNAKIAWGKIFQRKRETSSTRQILQTEVGATSNKVNESLNYSSTDSSGTHEQKLRPSTLIRTTKDIDDYQQATI